MPPEWYSPVGHEAPTDLTASAVEPTDRSHPNRVRVKPDLVGERVRAGTGYFRGDSAAVPSRTGTILGSRPDFNQPYAVAGTHEPPLTSKPEESMIESSFSGDGRGENSPAVISQ